MGGGKFMFIPNGFDEKLLGRLAIEERSFEEKDNLMITVGRLADPVKNTDMLLRALARTDLKGWKFCLIGPCDAVLEERAEQFFRDHPQKRRSVVFTGPIYDKKELWEYYNRSKVFVLTSRGESSAIVLGESKRFRNYIITTDVGSARDLIGDGRFGEYIPQDDDVELARRLQNVIDGRTDIDIYGNWKSSEIAWENVLEPLVGKLR